jgi:hypothetical protein
MTDIASPGDLMVAIERDARALDNAGRELAKAIQKQGDLEMRYERARQEALIKILHDSLEAKERVPAEDLRGALAHQQIPIDVYEGFLAGKARVDALKAWSRATEHSLSARQSLLNALKAELRAGA